MTAALLYLTTRSVVNNWRVKARRLREPRYFAGLAVGVLYLYWFIFNSGSRQGRSAGVLAAAARYHDAAVLVAAMALLVVVTLAWLWPGRRTARLGFSRADVQFLFTAPISRSDLIRYKVIRSQLGVFFGAAVMTIFLRPGSLTSGWTFFAGMAVVMAAINVHLVGMSLFLLRNRDASGRWRSLWPRAALVASIVVVLTSAIRSWPVAGAGGFDAGIWLDRLQQDLAHGAAGLLLWPWRALVRLPLSATAPEFLWNLPAVLGLLAVNYVWTVSSRAPFEEEAAEAAERRTNALSGPAPEVRQKAGSRRSPFRLAAAGRPEMAVLWKNLLMLGRYWSVSLVARAAALLLIMGFVLSRSPRAGGVQAAVAGVSFIVAMLSTFLGPQLARHDLRQDLAYIETLKLWPMRGAEIVRGEVLAPTLLLTSIVWFALPLSTVLGHDWPGRGPAWLVGAPWGWAAGAMLVAAGLILVQVLAHNALAVAFPAWARVGAGRAQGIDVMGQRMLMLAGMLLVVVVAALPAALAAALAGVAMYGAAGAVHVLACAIPAAAVLFVEGVVAAEALGALLERTDVSSVETGQS